MGSAEDPSATAITPDSAELLKVLRRLTHDGDHRGVIRLVERWAEIGDLPREARVAEARSLLDLRLMDRAWVRLKELTEADADDEEALLLIARLYVERGWPARARRALDRLNALGCDAPELEGLARRAEEPPVEPPSDARELERSGSPAQLLALAEVFLATGSFLRARSLLERVRRASPSNARAELLLWGIQGEFVRRGESLPELLRELCPPAAPAEDGDEDWDTAEHTDVGAGGDPGLTEAPTAEVSLELEGREDAPFPSLFRRPPSEIPELQLDEEATMTSVLAAPAELQEAGGDAGTDPGDGGGNQGGDTQIMAILPGPGRGLAPVEGPIHRPREGGPALSGPLDLRAWQQSMGVGGKDSQIPLDQVDAQSEDFLEDEDQDLVVMTRRELPTEEAPPAPAAPRKPIEVIEKFPQPLPAPPRPAPPVPAPEPPAFVEEDSVATPPTDWTRLLLVVALTAGLLVGAGMLLYRGVQSVAAGRVIEEAERVSAAGELAAMDELHERLLEEIRAGSPPRWARELAASRVALALWEQTGAEGLRDEVRARVEGAEGAPADAVAEMSAALALASGDVVRARTLLERVPPTRLGARALKARVALLEGDAGGALALWQPVEPEAQGLEHRLLWAEILDANGRAEEAMVVRSALRTEHGEDPLVFLARQEGAWEGDDPAARLAALEGWLDEKGATLPPRLRARAEVLRADLLWRLDQDEAADHAVALAVDADPTSPAALYRRAAASLYAQDYEAAVLDLQRCLDARPGDARCRRGMVQALITQGRLMEAAEVVAESLDPGDALLRAWIAAASENPDRALDLAPEPAAGEGSPLLWYVRARALAGLGGGEQERGRAMRAVSGSADPLDRLLLPSLLVSSASTPSTP